MSDKLVRPDRHHLFQIAEGQQGYFTTKQAHTSGFSDALLSHHTRRGDLLRIRRGLYRFRDFPSTPREEVVEAWRAAGHDTVVSHESALDIYELSDVIPESVHITIPRERRNLRLPFVTLHTVSDPIPASEITYRSGVRITTPERTIIDAAVAHLSPEQLRRAVRDATRRGLIAPNQLRASAARRGRHVLHLIEDALEGNTD